MPNNDSPPSPSNDRRASFAPGQKLTDLFGLSPPANNPSVPSAYPGPIAAAAANAQAQQRRRMSISTLGLSGSPTQTSPFGAMRPRRGSVSSASEAASVNENAIDETGEAGPPSSAGSSPFARRLSFGARAMRDVRGGGATAGSFNGRAFSSSTTATPAHAPSADVAGAAASEWEASGSSEQQHGKRMVTGVGGGGGVSALSSSSAATSSNAFARRTGEGGFNWSDQMRSRAERSSSIAASPTGAGPPAGFSGGSGGGGGGHHKAASVATMEQPAREIPKTPKAPDHFQERILKGDFYMD